MEKVEEGKRRRRRSRKLVVLVFRLWFCVTELLQQLEGGLFLFFFFSFVPPSFNLSASPLVYMCGGGQFECMTKFGRASERAGAARREKSARFSYAIIYRMMMKTRKAGKQQRLPNY
jgi:hypothetical protein